MHDAIARGQLATGDVAHGGVGLRSVADALSARAETAQVVGH